MQVTNCKTLQKVEIGMPVFMAPTGNARYWYPKSPYVKGIVTAIGRKYFTVNRGIDGIGNKQEEKYTLDGGQCVTDGTYGFELYASEDALMSDKTRDNQIRQIREYFSRPLMRMDVSAEAISKIHGILVEEGVVLT